MGGKHVGALLSRDVSAPGGVHVDSWKMTSTRHEHRTKAMGPARRTARRVWDVHGTDPARWPVQHPGVVLDAVPSTAHGACLGCQWLDVRGHWMGHSDWFERASIWPDLVFLVTRGVHRSRRSSSRPHACGRRCRSRGHNAWWIRSSPVRLPVHRHPSSRCRSPRPRNSPDRAGTSPRRRR